MTIRELIAELEEQKEHLDWTIELLRTQYLTTHESQDEVKRQNILDEVKAESKPKHGRLRSFTDAQKRTLVKKFFALLKTHTTAEAANLVKVNISLLYTWARKLNIKNTGGTMNHSRAPKAKKEKRTERTDEQRQELVEKFLSMRAKGIGSDKACKKLGIAYASVKAWMEKSHPELDIKKLGVANERTTNEPTGTTDESTGPDSGHTETA